MLRQNRMAARGEAGGTAAERLNLANNIYYTKTGNVVGKDRKDHSQCRMVFA